MSGPYRQFDPSELRTPGVTEPSAAELADALGAARDLEALAASDGIRPTEGFDDRVMAAIALEPAPRVVVTGGSAVRGTGITAFLFTVRNAWRVGTTGGRPFAVRAQALAFVFVVLLAAGSLAGAGAIAVAGLLDGTDNAPTPSVEPLPTALPTPETEVTPSPTPSATPSTEPTETAQPTETVKPTETARPTRTPKPGETPQPTDDHGGGGGPGPDGSGGGGGPGPDGSGGGPGPG
jgi:cell division septation protein DedD